jgi:transposase
MINLQTRELVLRWNAEGKTQEKIADLVGCSQSAVSRLIDKFDKTGSVKNLYRSGRPTPLTKETLRTLKKEFRKKALEANKKFCSVDLKQFSEIVENKTNKKYSTRHIQRMLHRLDFSRITLRPQHIKNDPKKVSEFREEFKKNLTNSIWVMKL